jgi:hypothetical protein
VRAVADDFHQLHILEYGTFDQDRIGDFERVIGERADDLGRRVRYAAQRFCQRFSHDGFHIADQALQDIAHQVALVDRKLRVGIVEQIAERFDKRGASVDRFIARERKQGVQVFRIVDWKTVEQWCRGDEIGCHGTKSRQRILTVR